MRLLQRPPWPGDIPEVRHPSPCGWRDPGGFTAGDHDIASLRETLAKLSKCDTHLRKMLALLEPFVRSLAGVDEDDLIVG